MYSATRIIEPARSARLDRRKGQSLGYWTLRTIGDAYRLDTLEVSPLRPSRRPVALDSQGEDDGSTARIFELVKHFRFFPNALDSQVACEGSSSLSSAAARDKTDPGTSHCSALPLTYEYTVWTIHPNSTLCSAGSTSYLRIKPNMAEKKFDMVPRGSYGSDLPGNTLLIGLRALDPLLQRHLLLNSPLPRLASMLGLRAPRPPVSGGLLLPAIGLTPYQSVIWAMSIGSAAKHIFWKLVTAKEPVYPAAAVAISIFNSVFNSLNTLLYDASAENPAYFPPWSVYIGTVLFVGGVLSETVSEVQRHNFKKDPKNEGKIYTGGLFSVVRHVSYMGYSMWRAGYAMASGGPVWGFLVGGWFLWDFGVRAVPVLDEYMATKYGEQWAKVKRDVPYALIPGIW